jgi:hypothetical protein
MNPYRVLLKAVLANPASNVNSSVTIEWEVQIPNAFHVEGNSPRIGKIHINPGEGEICARTWVIDLSRMPEHDLQQTIESNPVVLIFHSVMSDGSAVGVVPIRKTLRID